MLFRLPVLLASLFMAAQPGSADAPKPCQARLDLAWEGEMLTVTGHCRSLLDAPVRYRYQLELTRQGSGGQSRNSQGGEFVLPAQQEAVLSRVRVNAGPQDHYYVRLLVLDDAGHTVAQDSTSR